MRLFVLCLATSLLMGSLGFAQSNHTRELLPVPAHLSWQEGSLALDPDFTITSVGVSDARIELALRRMAERLGRAVPILKGTEPPRDASLVVEVTGASRAIQSVDDDESYSLSVTPKRAHLKAQNALGILRGLETFLQLVSREPRGPVVPAVTIEDRPRFAWRGLLIDACRHWQGVDVIKRNLDGMAAVKMNVLHWHLTEDQGFRVESRVFPRLHEQGSEGHYYTQDQIKDVIAYARDQGIRVVPEFDMPGHATAWLVGHPELGSAGGPYEITKRWGISDNAFDPSKEEVYRFAEAFLAEMTTLFPDDYVHIGGDEVTGRHWNANPRILDFMYAHDLRDKHDLQAHFTARVSQILARHGKKMVGWDEILRSDLPKHALIQSWRGTNGLVRAARQGYDSILSHGYYLDHMVSAATHYAVDPIPPDSPLRPAEKLRVLGGEACMWGEFVSPETIDSRVWPRAAAVAERLWSPSEVRDIDDLYRRLEHLSLHLETLGLMHRSNYTPMLQRLVGSGPVEPMKLLADVVEPVKFYGRGTMRAYTTETPLNRLVDAARPESLAARRIRGEVDQLVRSGPAFSTGEAIQSAFLSWKNNHSTLDPLLASSPLGSEARSLSRDLSALGDLGLQALQHLVSSAPVPPSWFEEAEYVLEKAEVPRAEVELAIVPAVRKLVLAASQKDKLKTLSIEEWSAELDAQLEAHPRP